MAMTPNDGPVNMDCEHGQLRRQCETCDLRAENERLRGLIKALASGPTVYGSESFQRVRDQLNPKAKALLMEVLS